MIKHPDWVLITFKINILNTHSMKHTPHCNSLCSCCSPLLLQLSVSLAWDIQMTVHVKQNVLSNSDELRLWPHYLKNAASMGWVLVWWRFMTQQQLSVQKHLSFTLQWLCWLQVHVFTWWTITSILSVSAFMFTITTTIAIRIHVYNNVVCDIWNNPVSFQIFFPNTFNMFLVSLLVVLCYKYHQVSLI